MMSNTFTRVARYLGKGEVVSSILTGSTIAAIGLTGLMEATIATMMNSNRREKRRAGA
jgi:hypothetical protein